MAGEIFKTEGIVLRIRPWSRTSHVVTWLTPDHGPLATLVKGAVRPKSAFLGQYDLYYTCDVLYYAGGKDLHPLREASASNRRDFLRDDWRAVTLAGYAADLVGELAPTGPEAAPWYAFLNRFLDNLADRAAEPIRTFLALERDVLALAGLEPDFSEIDPAAEWTPFALDGGRVGTGLRTVRLTPGTVRAVTDPEHADAHFLLDGVRFNGVFFTFHLERPADIRRAVVRMLTDKGVS